MLQCYFLPYSERVKNISKWQRFKLDASVPFGQNRIPPGNNARIRGIGIALLSWILIRTRTHHRSRKFHKVERTDLSLIANGGFACSDNRCNAFEQNLWFGD